MKSYRYIVADLGFSIGVVNPRGRANLLFGLFFAKNCMKN